MQKILALTPEEEKKLSELTEKVLKDLDGLLDNVHDEREQALILHQYHKRFQFGTLGYHAIELALLELATLGLSKYSRLAKMWRATKLAERSRKAKGANSLRTWLKALTKKTIQKKDFLNKALKVKSVHPDALVTTHGVKRSKKFLRLKEKNRVNCIKNRIRVVEHK